VTDPLRELWDFDDLDATAARFRELLADEGSATGRAVVLTQLARVHGLRGDLDDGDALLDEAASLAGTSRAAAAQIDLERGRLRRSGGDPVTARPLFESAYAGALETEQHFLAADAAHMVALVAGDRAGFVAWTQRGIDLAVAHEGAGYWAGPLLNNLGWEYYDTGEFERALDAFERALVARERDPSNASAIELALYAVGKALRALGRSEEAVPLLERAIASAKRRGHGDGWLHEELAEEFAALGRDADARVHATLALPLLERDDSSLAEDSARRERLASLAA
jgi:tetratricopeptide (TPR) repeat protein